MDLTLIRISQKLNDPQKGVLLVDGSPRLLTLEPPNLNNQSNISCIPMGSYPCKRVFNKKLASGYVVKETFQLMDVPDRDGILFHVGNYIEDTHGCILIGLAWPNDSKLPPLLKSQDGFNLFIELTRGEYMFNLEVKYASS